MNREAPLHAVTFDCWGTLIYETRPDLAAATRARILADWLRDRNIEVSDEKANAALHDAWERHWQNWREGVSTGGLDITRWALEAFGVHDRELADELGRNLQEVSLSQEILPLKGARQTLEQLARRGIRRALICDTGFSPARVVRQLLDRAELLEFLEVQIFSDEQGVPKPSPRMFHAALGQLGVAPENALHVGDVRRTDIAGARGVGMRSVRIRSRYDDPSELPDADAVVDSHAELQEILKIDGG